MDEFQEEQSAEKNRRGHPEMDIGKDVSGAAACWFHCAHALAAVSVARTNRRGLYTADKGGEEGR